MKINNAWALWIYLEENYQTFQAILWNEVVWKRHFYVSNNDFDAFILSSIFPKLPKAFTLFL